MMLRGLLIMVFLIGLAGGLSNNAVAQENSNPSIMDTPFAANIIEKQALGLTPEVAKQLTTVPDNSKKPVQPEIKLKEEKLAPSLYGDWPVSLFFSSDETLLLKKAMDFYVLGGSNTAREVFTSSPDGLNPLLPITAHLSSVNMPIFDLHSLVYNNPNSWTVWVGKSAFSSDLEDDEGEELQVISVGRDFVNFLWTPKKDAFAMLSVNEKLKSDKDDLMKEKFKNRIAANIVAKPKLDDKLQTVTFGLRINQVFYPDKMLITEGKLPESKVVHKEDNKNAAKKAGGLPTNLPTTDSTLPAPAGNPGTVSILKDMPNIKEFTNQL